MPKTPTDHAPAYGLKKTGLIDLNLPSGGLVQVRRPGLQGLIKAGILESIDTLTAIVATETIPKAKGDTAPSPKPKAPTGEQIEEALAVMDKIALYVVTQPTLLPTEIPDDEHPGKTRPIRDDERDADAYYVDDVEIDDKSFIVQYVLGGSSDLDKFRETTAAAMGSVPAGT